MLRYDLLRLPLLRKILINRWSMLILRATALGVFVFAILTGLLGTSVGNRNFAIVAVWIAWWAALMLAIVPIFGRGWCAICPIPMPGEWLQNKAVLGPVQFGNTHKSGRLFPKIFRNIWLQNVAFTMLALFSAIILTQPSVTTWVLLGILLVASGISLVFKRRSFCRYLCPVGGFIGLYSQLAPLELRVADTKICAVHTEKSCYRGNAYGYGCPWNVFPGGLSMNTNCGLCMECLRTCEYNNIVLNLRPPGADLGITRGRGLDEAFKAFIMLGSALAYAAVMVGPWGTLKDAAYQVGSTPWMGYALGLVVLDWGLLPGLFYLATRAAHFLVPTRHNPRQMFKTYATALLPLGFAAWVAFSLSFVLSNISYLLPVLSDPFGWGWNLFGTAGNAWTPYLSGAIPALQTIVLLGGLLWAGYTAQRVAEERAAPRQAWPVVIFCCLVTIALLWLLIV